MRQACLGDIYDVTKGSDFYGPEGPYNNFAGRCALYDGTRSACTRAEGLRRSEANRALAKMSLKVEDCVADIEGESLQRGLAHLFAC